MCYGACVAFAITAVALFAAGAALAVGATVALGWRRTLGLDRPGPEPERPWLVFRGPFGSVRHPHALALLLMIAAMVLAWRSLAALGVAAGGALGVLLHARAVDRALARRGGAAHARYRRTVPFLVPTRRRR